VYVVRALVRVCSMFSTLTTMTYFTIHVQICVRCYSSGLILVCQSFVFMYCVCVCVLRVLGCYVVQSIVVLMFVCLLCPCRRCSLFVLFTVLRFVFVFPFFSPISSFSVLFY